MSQPRYLAPLRCRGRDIRGPGRGVGVSVPCFIRFDIKGASHFTLDGLNYFILFVCSAVLPGGRTRPPRRRVPHRTPPRALETS